MGQGLTLPVDFDGVVKSVPVVVPEDLSACSLVDYLRDVVLRTYNLSIADYEVCFVREAKGLSPFTANKLMDETTAVIRARHALTVEYDGKLVRGKCIVRTIDELKSVIQQMHPSLKRDFVISLENAPVSRLLGLPPMCYLRISHKFEIVAEKVDDVVEFSPFVSSIADLDLKIMEKFGEAKDGKPIDASASVKYCVADKWISVKNLAEIENLDFIKAKIVKNFRAFLDSGMDALF